MDEKTDRPQEPRLTKEEIINKTFAKVPFDENKTAKEIYQEMRNEWNRTFDLQIESE